MFGCALNYSALRLLGVPKDDEVMVRARSLLHELGTYTMMKHLAVFAYFSLFTSNGLKLSI